MIRVSSTHTVKIPLNEPIPLKLGKDMMNQYDSFFLEQGFADGEKKPVGQPHQMRPEIHHGLEADEQSKTPQLPSRSHSCLNVSRIPRVSALHRHCAAPYKISRLKRNTPKGIKPIKPRVSRPNNPRAKFLLDLPVHNYVLPPGGPLNFTVVEIISILPNWFRSRDLATRFQNNGISAGVHFLILHEHRQLDLATDTACDRARDHISDAYRKAMRLIDPTWTKHGHRASLDFVVTSLRVNNVCLEDLQDSNLNVPAPIAFKDLATGMKKLPQGYDAGDLTRALEFAMNNQRDDGCGNQVEFIFPDDLHEILDRVGRAQVSIEHTDPYILARYNDVLRQAQQNRYKKHAELRKQQQQNAELGRQMHMVAQQERYPHWQPALQTEVSIASQCKQDIHPSQYVQLEDPFLSRPKAHGRVQPPFPVPQSDNKTELLPLDMNVQLFDQTNTSENTPPFPPVAYQASPYNELPSSSSAYPASQVAAATVARILKQDRAENEGSQHSHDNNLMAELDAQDTKPCPLETVHHSSQAPAPVIFQSIPELNQDPQHREVVHAAIGLCHESFDIDVLAFPESYSMTGVSGPPTLRSDIKCSQEDNQAFYDRLAVPETNIALGNDAGIAGSGDFVPLVPRLVDCVEGDDLGDMSELAHAVRWARSLGGMADDFTVDDVQFIVAAMRTPLEEV